MPNIETELTKTNELLQKLITLETKKNKAHYYRTFFTGILYALGSIFATAILAGTIILYLSKLPFLAQLKPLFNQYLEKSAPTPTKAPANQSTNAPEHKRTSALIKTTFVPQAPEKEWGQPWQDACEEAALLTVHYYYQNQNPDLTTIKSDLEKMIEYETTQNWTHDVNIDQMSQIATKYLKYKTKIIDNPTVDIIKSYLTKNIPIVVPAAGKVLFKENTHFKSGGPYYHNLVILGFDDETSKFIVHDVGTQFGPYFQYSYDLLITSIHDFPGKKEDILSGPKRVLALIK